MPLAARARGRGVILRDCIILVRIIAALVIAAGLSACASTEGGMPRPEFLASPDQPVEPAEISDPLEKQNRAVFESNQEINHAIIYPLAKAYNENVPEDVRDRIDAFTTNLGEPVVFANDVLQLRMRGRGNDARPLRPQFDGGDRRPLRRCRDASSCRISREISGRRSTFGACATAHISFCRSWGRPTCAMPSAAVSSSRRKFPPPVSIRQGLPQQWPDMSPQQARSSARMSDLRKVGDMETLEQGSLDFYSMLRSVADQKRQADLREALETSALTAPPSPPDPNAIEPVMVLTASPAWSEKPAPLANAKPEVAEQAPETTDHHRRPRDRHRIAACSEL